jgi:hypothetical protein
MKLGQKTNCINENKLFLSPFPPARGCHISRSYLQIYPTSRSTYLSRYKRDDPEQGPKAARTETGEKSVVGRKKGRPARGDHQALPQETQETLPLK